MGSCVAITQKGQHNPKFDHMEARNDLKTENSKPRHVCKRCLNKQDEEINKMNLVKDIVRMTDQAKTENGDFDLRTFEILVDQKLTEHMHGVSPQGLSKLLAEVNNG